MTYRYYKGNPQEITIRLRLAEGLENAEENS